jgi:hypothetical protein
MVKRRETAHEQRARRAAEYRTQRELHEQQQRRAVIVEFGGRKRMPMLVPEDDPANNELVLRLADEVLLLRSQLRRVGRAVELAQTGQLAAVLPPGPYTESSEQPPGNAVPEQIGQEIGESPLSPTA